MYKLNQGSTKSNRTRRVIFLTLPVLALLLVAAGLLVWHRHKRPAAVATPSVGAPTQSAESLKADAQAGNAIKQTDTKTDTPTTAPTTPTTPDSKRAVTPQILPISSTRIGGNVPGLTENGGTCTLTLTSGATTKTYTQPATANAQTTDCQPFALDFSASGWTAVLSYSSATATGTSSPKVVE